MRGSRLPSLMALGTWSLLAAPALGQSFEVSTDTTTTLGTVVVDRRQPAEDDGATISLTALGPSSPGITLPSGANLDAFDRLPTGEVVFSTDIAVAVAGLPAPGVAGAADVVMVDAQGPTIVFSPAAVGLPAGVDVDAVGLEPDSDLLLSFDTTVSLAGVVVDDEDVVRIDGGGGAPVVVYDGSAQGVATGLDLDGVYRDLDTNHLLVSFDGSGSLAGNPFDDEDVLDWNPNTSAYAFAYDGSAAPASWPTGADLDAISGFPLDDDGDGYPNLSDNCDLVANSQADIGGVGQGSGPDGIGDACQCGDANDDGRVTGADGTAIKRAALNLAPYGAAGVSALPAPGKCDVNGGSGGDPVYHCSGQDATFVQRASLGLPPGVQQVCLAADGN